MANFDSFFEELELTEIELFEKLEECEKDGRWIYRGQKSYSWGLKTSLGRMFEEHFPPLRLNTEIAILKRFQREAHHYGISDIDFLNIPEWLSLMQHHGAPTRLLDWTHSPWVGLFFALIDLEKPDQGKENYSALWVADWNSINEASPQTVKDIFDRDHNVMSIDDFTEIVSSGEGVIKLNSFRQNERQIIQQGTFLFPLNIEKTFQENWATSQSQMPILKKIKLSHDLKAKAIQKLYRMNISFTTLYPGIEGFSRSLNHLHNIPGIFKLENNITTYEDYKNKFKKK